MLFTAIKPMLLSIGSKPFDDDQYLFEPKWDGWRIIIHKKGDRIEAFSKNGRLVTSRFPELQEMVNSISSPQAILDCEAVCLRDGKHDFDRIQWRGRLSDQRKIAEARILSPVTFVAFDIIYKNDDITQLPLLQRKEILAHVIQPTDLLIATMFIEAQGISLQNLTIKNDWEGTVAKKKNSKWIEGIRTKEWLKIKNFKFIDTIILGYRLVPNFALYVGVHFPTIKYKQIATVDKGIQSEEMVAFLEIVKPLHLKKEKNIQWIEPVLCCKIQYQERTELHYLRITSFKGFLFDKKPEDCQWHS